MVQEFLDEGFTRVDQLILPKEVEQLRALYNELLADVKKTEGLRSDLAGEDSRGKSVERITQIMRPSLVEPRLLENAAYDRARAWAQQALGADIELDFDMLINKSPRTDTETPWHQDAAYWIKMPDHRAVSCWLALDEVDEENGCMWFIPRSGAEILPHQPAAKGGALRCAVEIDTKRAVPRYLRPGGCTFHDGYTLHYSGGNRSDRHRRALILNFRPQAMIELERQQGMDHTGTRKVRQ